MKNLLRRNNEFVTIHNKCSKIPPSTSVHFANRVFFAWVDFHVCLCEQQHPKCERAIRLVYLSFFCKLRYLSNPTNKF